MTGLVEIDVPHWPLIVGCQGISCGRCGTLLVAKPAGRPIATDLAVLEPLIGTHAAQCTKRQRLARQL